MENLTSLTHSRCRAFSWPNSLPALLLCVKAAEPRRHREDSPVGGRSHAIPPSRGPETGSLIDSSNTPYILLPFIKAFPLPPSQEEAKKRRMHRHWISGVPMFFFPCEVHYLNLPDKSTPIIVTEEGWIVALLLSIKCSPHFIHYSCTYTSAAITHLRS